MMDFGNENYYQSEVERQDEENELEVDRQTMH